MDSLKKSITDLAGMFNKQMSEFEAEVQKAPSTTTTTSGLATEFNTFRAFILKALDLLQRQVEVLAQSVESVEMRGRRKILLLHGVTEAKEENTIQVVAQVIKNRFNLPEFNPNSIKRCHRMGRSSSHKARPVLVKLQQIELRDKIWFDKSKLKGSGITVSEFLTKSRHKVFMAARERFGVSQCWTREGTVYVLGSDGTRHRVVTHADLEKIGQQSEHEVQLQEQDTVQVATNMAAKAGTTKPKRAAAKK